MGGTEPDDSTRARTRTGRGLRGSRHGAKVGRLGQRFRTRRMAAGLTQYEVSVRSGVSERAICAFEQGRSGPRLLNYVAMLDAVKEAERAAGSGGYEARRDAGRPRTLPASRKSDGMPARDVEPRCRECHR
jgi:transcriptional regulator with XRE-family HTH domain